MFRKSLSLCTVLSAAALLAGNQVRSHAQTVYTNTYSVVNGAPVLGVKTMGYMNGAAAGGGLTLDAGKWKCFVNYNALSAYVDADGTKHFVAKAIGTYFAGAAGITMVAVDVNISQKAKFVGGISFQIKNLVNGAILQATNAELPLNPVMITLPVGPAPIAE